MGRGLKKGPSGRVGGCFSCRCVCPPPPCAHRVLAEAVVHFPQTLAEVTLAAGPGGKISLRNHVEDEAGEPCGGAEGAVCVRVCVPFPGLGTPAQPPDPPHAPPPRARENNGDGAVAGRGRVSDGGRGPGLPHHFLPQGVSGEFLPSTPQPHVTPQPPPQPPLCPQGLLTFAEASNLPLTVHYDVPGR